jgi:hypothetical protein
MQQTPAHVIISWVFFILIGMGFAYSYFFYPDAHPLNCVVKSYTGKDCPACGFSRAFSYYSHGEVNAGKAANPLSWPVFLFFAGQGLARVVVIFYYHVAHRAFHPRMVISDGIISISLFLLAFLPVILKV